VGGAGLKKMEKEICRETKENFEISRMSQQK
jgi:hypothetical protein